MASLAELEAIVGAGNARDAGLGDAVDGAIPRFVAAAADARQVSELLRLASRTGWKVAPRGAGTKLGWGNPPERADLVLDTRRLTALVEHTAGDLVARVEAGMSLEAFQSALAGAALRALLRSTLVPTSIELEWSRSSGRLSVGLDGIEPGVEAQAAAAVSLLGGHGAARVLSAGEVDRRLSELAAFAPGPGHEVELKITYLPADLPRLLDGIAALGGPRARVKGQAGNGVLHARIPGGDDSGIVRVVARLRSHVKEGSVVVLEAAPEVRERVDAWGPVGSALPVMRRVKEQFDPGRVLNPGRFVGGI